MEGRYYNGLILRYSTSSGEEYMSRRDAYRVLWGGLRERDRLGDLVVDGRTIL